MCIGAALDLTTKLTCLEVFWLTFVFLFNLLTICSVFFHHQMTPLHLAAEQGNHEIVGYLVRKGADINIRDRKGASISNITTKYQVLLT